jgi:hypothetical protein
MLSLKQFIAGVMVFALWFLYQAQAQQLTTETKTVTATEARPGETSPITNPRNLTIFNIDDIGLLASKGTTSSTTVLDLAPNNAALTEWTMAGQQLQHGDTCTIIPHRRLSAGRVATPDYEQPICVTPFGLSLYPGMRGIATGNYLAYSFTNPGPSGKARAFDSDTGDMDLSAASDDKRHMEIVTARRNLNNVLTVEIIQYQPKRDKQAANLASAGQWSDNSGLSVSGDVAIALGDYNNDGHLDILVAADTSTGTTGPGRISLYALSYAPKKQILKLQSKHNITTSATPRSLTLTAGDFGSLGFDQAILSYYPIGGNIRLEFYQLNNKLHINGAKVSKESAAKPATGSFFEASAGLFHFDPKSTQGGNPAFAFHTRQLALAWAESDGNVKAMIANLTPALSQFQLSPPTQITGSGEKSRTDDIGPGLAVGNFVGLLSGGVTPIDQIAVVIPTLVQEGQSATIPELVVAKVGYKNSSGFSISRSYYERQPIYKASGLLYSPGIAAYDSRGLAFYLGNPAHITVPALIDPQYVIEMPPRHIDCLPNGDDSCDIVNISGDTGFTIELIDSQGQTLQQSTTDQMSTEFGTAVSASVSGTVGGGVMEIGEVEVSDTVKTSFSYQNDTMERQVNTHYHSVETQRSATTNVDDHLIWNARLIDIWRYPVYSLNLKTPKKFPYYDILIPGPLHQFSGGGLSMDWYNPLHVNNNALSYPPISDENFPSDLGEFTYKTKDGSKVKRKQPLNDRLLRTFDGNMQTFSLNYTDEVGGSSEKSYSYSLSSSTDITTSFKASAQIELFNGSVETEGSVSLNSKSSWERSSLAERTMKNSRGITLNQPQVDGITTRSYDYLTLIYITGNGGLKVAHAVDVLGSAAGRGWWKETYGGKPDAALNLPNRVFYSQMDGQWELNNEESYYWMRGLYLTKVEYDETTKAYPFVTGGVDDGTKLRVVVGVYNFSLDTTATDVKVNYAYQPLDSETLKPIGKAKTFATSQPLDLPPLAVKEIPAIWNTTGLAGKNGTPYRFVITLDTGDEKEIHGNNRKSGGNNRGIWPWGGSGFYVFKEGTHKAALEQPHAAHAQVDLTMLRMEQPRAGNSHTAQVTIDSVADDPRQRLLVVLQSREEGENIHKVLASRTLRGLRKGRQTLHIPVRAQDLDQRPALVWLTPGGTPSDPFLPTRSIPDP